jgi:hypothetical protein
MSNAFYKKALAKKTFKKSVSQKLLLTKAVVKLTF